MVEKRIAVVVVAAAAAAAVVVVVIAVMDDGVVVVVGEVMHRGRQGSCLTWGSCHWKSIMKT